MSVFLSGHLTGLNFFRLYESGLTGVECFLFFLLWYLKICKIQELDRMFYLTLSGNIEFHGLISGHVSQYFTENSHFWNIVQCFFWFGNLTVTIVSMSAHTKVTASDIPYQNGHPWAFCWGRSWMWRSPSCFQINRNNVSF